MSGIHFSSWIIWTKQWNMEWLKNSKVSFLLHLKYYIAFNIHGINTLTLAQTKSNCSNLQKTVIFEWKTWNVDWLHLKENSYRYLKCTMHFVRELNVSIIIIIFGGALPLIMWATLLFYIFCEERKHYVSLSKCSTRVEKSSPPH